MLYQINKDLRYILLSRVHNINIEELLLLCITLHILTRLNAEQEGVVVRLERQLSRLKEQSVDHQQLLNTITNDKETISR